MAQNLYTGFHAVEERLREYSSKPKSELKLAIYYSKPGPRVKKILSLAESISIPCKEVSQDELDTKVASLPETALDHRGVLLCAEGESEKPRNQIDFDLWLKDCPENATVLMLDSVTDPHNVGAIIRSCDQFGASLLIIPEKRSASNVQDNQIIARSSAGASAWVNVSVVSNLVRTAQLLKDAGFWIYAADAGGVPLQKISFAEKTCIVMGSEGSGISRLLSQTCDTSVSIPTCGKIDSLNVSVAAGVLLYERYRQTV